jgi:excisionase family DNA binding protein
MQQVLLRMDEAADRMAVSRSHLERMVARGEIATIRVGRSRRIPVDEIRRWVQERLTEQQPCTWIQLPLLVDSSGQSQDDSQ